MRHIVNAHWMGLSFTKTATNSGDSLASVLAEAYEWADWAAQETGVPIGEQDIVEVTTTR